MKSSPKNRLHSSYDGKASAFTILELLTATAVLALLLTVLLQITNQTLQASRTATQQIDSTQSARIVIDALSKDISDAITSNGATILVKAVNGVPSLSFLVSGRGPASAASRILSVNYQLQKSNLTRAYNAIEWSFISSSSPSLLIAAETASAVTSPSSGSARSKLASGILQFSVLAVLEDGSMVSVLTAPAGDAWGASGTVLFDGQTVPTSWVALVPSRPPMPSPLNSATARVKALMVAVASVDEQSLQLIDQALPTFSQPTSGDPVPVWEAELATKTLPGPVRSAIRFHSKVIPLP